MVKLRLKRMGTIDKPFYRIVAVDSRKKRDGKYLECVGYYDPKTDPLTIKIESERALYWLGVGAQPSYTVRSLFRKTGVLETRHNLKFKTDMNAVETVNSGEVIKPESAKISAE